MHFNDDFSWGFYYKHSSIPSLLSFQSLDDNIDLNLSYCVNDQIDMDIYYRLLLILPKSSRKLLPYCLWSNIDENLYEEKILYDVKTNQVSLIDTEKLEKFQLYCKTIYNFNKHKLTSDEKKRSLNGRVFLYKFDPTYQKNIKSYYGDLINNRVRLLHL